MQKNQSTTIKSAAEIGAMAANLTPQNQVCILNTISALLNQQAKDAAKKPCPSKT